MMDMKCEFCGIPMSEPIHKHLESCARRNFSLRSEQNKEKFIVGAEWTRSKKIEDLRRIFAKMDPEKGQRLRQAYYKAVEGLAALAEELKPRIEDALIDEYELAKTAKQTMDGSYLGGIL